MHAGAKMCIRTYTPARQVDIRVFFLKKKQNKTRIYLASQLLIPFNSDPSTSFRLCSFDPKIIGIERDWREF
jgi:hypothetical protein